MSRHRVPSPRAAKQTLRRRATALLWALAFVLGTVGEGFGLHPCPHHDSAGIAEQGTTAHHPRGRLSTAVGAAEQHADHGSGCDESLAAHGDSGHDPQPHSGPCTCGSSACQASAGGGAALPADPAVAPLDGIVSDEHTLVRPTVAPVVLRPPHFLPFAQAPPHRI